MSIAVQTDKTAGDYARLAVRVEDLGFDGMSVFSDLGYQPPLMALIAIAQATSRIRIGAACWNPFTTHPVEIAGQAAALDIAIDGRGYVGLARGSWLDSIGIDSRDGLARLADSAEIIRRVLAGDDSGYRGTVLGVEPGFGFAFPRRRDVMPLLFGVWGPKASTVAARYAYEVKIGGSPNPDMVVVIRDRLAAGAVIAGRPADAVGVVAGAVTVVDRDRVAARRKARSEVAMYLDVVGALDPTVELPAELLHGVRDALARGDADTAGALIPDPTTAVADRYLAGTDGDAAALLGREPASLLPQHSPDAVAAGSKPPAGRTPRWRRWCPPMRPNGPCCRADRTYGERDRPVREWFHPAPAGADGHSGAPDPGDLRRPPRGDGGGLGDDRSRVGRGAGRALRLRPVPAPSANRGQLIAARHIAGVVAQCRAWADPAGDDFYPGLVGGAEVPEPLRRSLSRDAAAAAAAAFADGLERDLLPRASGRDAVGRELYAVTASAFLGSTVDLDDTYAWGWSELARIRAEIAAVAATVSPDGVTAAVAARDADPVFQLHGHLGAGG